MKRFFLLIALGLLAAGCAQRSAETTASTEGATTAVAFNVEGAPTVEFSVPDMMCPESCAVETKEILSKRPGAKEVVVDFDSKTATVAVEEGKFDAQAAIAALVDKGFNHSTLKSDAPQTDATPTTAEEKPAG